MPGDAPLAAIDTLPLTQAQLGVLQGQQMCGDDSVFYAAECVYLDGPLDTAAFGRALQATLLDAPSLHLRLVERAGELRQQLLPPQVPALVVRDIDEADLDAEIARELAQRFDPHSGHLLSHRLYRLAPQRHCWLHRAHHLLLDGYGFQMIARRVAAHYGAALGGAAAADTGFSGLAAVVDADLAYQASADRTADRAFWLQRLAGLQPMSLCAKPAAGIGRGRRHRGQLPKAVCSSLKARAAEFSLSWPELLIAAFAGFVAAHGHGRDVVLGLPVMQRLGSPAARTPCTAMNVMPLPVAQAGALSLPALSLATRESLRGLRARQRYRFEHLEGDLEHAGHARGLLATEINVMPFEHPGHYGQASASTRILAGGPVEDLAAIFVARGDAIGFDLDGRPQNYGAEELSRHWQNFVAFLQRWLDRPAANAADLR